MSTPAPFTAKRPAARNAWTALGVLLVVYLVNFMDRQVFAVLQEEFRVDLNLSDSQLALLGGTAFALFYATLGIPIAILADRTNRIRLIAAACVVWSVFTALSGLASNFLQMLLARIGVASGEAGGVSPSYSVLSDYFPPSKRAFAIGLFSMGAPAGAHRGLGAGRLYRRCAELALGLHSGGACRAFCWRWCCWFWSRNPSAACSTPRPCAPRKPMRCRRLKLVFATPPAPVHGRRRGDLVCRIQPLSMGALLSDPLSGHDAGRGGHGLSPLFALGLIGSVAGGWMADRVGPDGLKPMASFQASPCC
jgi:MFS family permease